MQMKSVFSPFPKLVMCIPKKKRGGGGGRARGGQKTMHTPSHTESAIKTEALQFNYPNFKMCVSGHPMFCLNTFTIKFGLS